MKVSVSEAPKYDVAISFLSRDVNLAKALYDQLSNGLEVFFFPRSQEELAGTDGLESMREPFRNESRVNVVLYREGWGKTPWTGVEEAAIKGSCLATGVKSLFFLSIESTGTLPKWLPETHVRFNYADFTLEQAVGAIKARARDRGSQIQPMTPIRKAQLLQAEEEFRHEKSYLLSSEAAIFKEVEALFAEVERQCDAVNAMGHCEIQHRVNTVHREPEQFCTIGQDNVSATLVWYRPYSNSLHQAVLIHREFDAMLILPPNYQLFYRPEPISEKQYLPDISRAKEYGWKPSRGPESFISNGNLAEQFVMSFLDLLERDRQGKLKRRERQPRSRLPGSGSAWG